MANKKPFDGWSNWQGRWPNWPKSDERLAEQLQQEELGTEYEDEDDDYHLSLA